MSSRLTNEALDLLYYGLYPERLKEEKKYTQSEFNEQLRLARIEIQREEEKKYLAKLPTESTEPIIAYRVWRYNEGKLQSAFKNTIWPQYTPITKDIYEDKGIHGVKDYKKVPELFRDYRTHLTATDGIFDEIVNLMVAGSIYMWGHTVEHEIGYLSEYAYPKELYVGSDFDTLKIMELEENYGVPVTVRDELAVDKLPKKDTLNTFTKLFYYGATMPKP